MLNSLQFHIIMEFTYALKTDVKLFFLGKQYGDFLKIQSM